MEKYSESSIATEGAWRPSNTLKKSIGLSPAPTTKQKRELPIYRLPELQFGMDADKGTKYLSAGCTERHQPKIQGAEFRGTGKTGKALSHRSKANKKRYREG